MTAGVENINLIKQRIKRAKSLDFELDLSAMNLLDAAKVAVLTSALYYTKNPEGKIKCKLQSENIKSFISTLAVKNLEFV